MTSVDRSLRERESGSRSEPPTLSEPGRPYSVMDLVVGVPITEYCDKHNFSVRQRLELMVSVCQAVQHAHQKGVIHRDIKPSNVLVAEDDGKAIPKVIDFGVAKAIAQGPLERTTFTQIGQIIGTFEYMSPEQARFSDADVDTRTDIYSLGVLLYELLTGSTPLERQRLETVAFDETLRIIREEEPPQPSTRLSSLSLRERVGVRGTGELASVAANRQTEPARLSRSVRGELDWIVMKCLEKDRNRRYETASALAADIMHHLAHEPVSAGPPSRLYRAGKFVRRNRVPVLAALLVAAAILSGVAASAWQAIRATRAERSALTERDAKERALREAVANAKVARESADAERAAKEAEAAQRKQAEDIANFLIGAFRAQYPEHDMRAVAELLKNSAEELQDGYSNNPGANAALLATMGRSYAGLRRFDDAERMYRKCLDLADDPGLVDRIRREFATCLLRQGKSEEGVAILQALFQEKLSRADVPDRDELRAGWSGLPEVRATADGNPGMDGLDLDGDRDYVVLPRVYFDGRPPWTLEAIVRPVEIDQSTPAGGSHVGWTSLISATDAGAIALDTSRRRWAIELYTALDFHLNSSAGEAQIVAHGGTAAGAVGARVSFNGAHAGNATIFAGTGSGGGAGAVVSFNSGATGDTARLVANAGGTFDFGHQHSFGGTQVGSIEGDGTFVLNGSLLTTGNRNTSTTVSGPIVNGFRPGGALTKVGAGTLTLAGAHT